MQKALLQRIPGECCLFKDVLDIFQDGACAARANMDELETYRDKISWAYDAPCHCSAWCIQHSCNCSVQTTAGSRVGGFPCQDFSTAGLQAGETGPQAPVIAAFGKKSCLTQNPVLVIENVDACPRSLVQETFQEYEWAAESVFSPAHVGFECTSRKRPPVAQYVAVHHVFAV